MVFYQAVLLAGYLYAHFDEMARSRRQALLHLVILALPLLVLPTAWAMPILHCAHRWLWLDNPGEVFVGLPFFAVSASASMLQKWFADTGHPAGKDPYFLYAASNLGSMLALLGYPTIIEPMLPLAGQSRVWQFGYLLLGLLTVGCVRFGPPRGAAVAIAGTSRSIVEAAFLAERPVEERTVPAPAWGQRIRWLALAFARPACSWADQFYFRRSGRGAAPLGYPFGVVPPDFRDRFGSMANLALSRHAALAGRRS